MLNWFFPKATRDKLPIALRKRVPILVYMDLMLMAYFMLSTYTRYKADPVGARTFAIVIMINCWTIFPLSVLLVRLGRYSVAAFAGSFGLLLCTVAIGALLPITSPLDIYRFSVYLIAAAVGNSMVAIRKDQIPIFTACKLALYVAITFIFYPGKLGGFQGELRTIFTTMLLLNVAVDIVLLFTNKLSNDLVAIADEEMRKTQAKADALSSIMGKTKGSFEVGKTLLQASNDSLETGKAIRAALDGIRRDAGGLSTDSRRADVANKLIVQHAEGMRHAVQEQNDALESTSAAVTEIMTTIQNMASIAQDKKVTMDAVISSVASQATLLRKVNEGFARIQEASKRILTVAAGIMDVSEKTNMLAMNASIEAAHAGATGKGFAVISQEIRKLSEETKHSTESIREALTMNEAVVNEAAASVARFTTDIASVNEEVRATFHAMEEIINGLGEMSKGTKDLISSTGSMVGISQEVELNVQGVTEQIAAGSNSVETVSRFSSELEEKIAKATMDFASIEDALGRVRAIGESNIAQISELERDLAAIEEG